MSKTPRLKKALTFLKRTMGIVLSALASLTCCIDDFKDQDDLTGSPTTQTTPKAGEKFSKRRSYQVN